MTIQEMFYKELLKANVLVTTVSVDATWGGDARSRTTNFWVWHNKVLVMNAVVGVRGKTHKQQVAEAIDKCTRYLEEKNG